MSLQVLPIAPKRIGSATGVRFVYAAKFLCGNIPAVPGNPQLPSPDSPLGPGEYMTAINILNVQREEVEFDKWAVITLPQHERQRGKVGQAVTENLRAGDGLEVDCDDISRLLSQPPGPPLPPFVKGFVVISSPRELEVVAVYSRRP